MGGLENFVSARIFSPTSTAHFRVLQELLQTLIPIFLFSFGIWTPAAGQLSPSFGTGAVRKRANSDRGEGGALPLTNYKELLRPRKG